MNSFEYAKPESLKDVFNFLNDPGTMVKGSGIDLLDMMKEGLIQPKRLVHLRSLKDLHFLNENSAGVTIGPNVTLDELSSHEKLKGRYQALAQAADAAATPQIRNAATLGGNLCQRPRCWYFRSHDFDCKRKGGKACFALDGENQYHAIFGNNGGCVIVHPSATATALMALGAKLKITSPKGEREISIDDFFVLPVKDIFRENILEANEIITAVTIPPAPGGYISYYYKQKEKQAFDWPVAEVAVGMQMNGKTCADARIVLGAAAPIPWRVPKAEAVLKNQTITRELARKAAEAAMTGATPLSENAYKIPVFKAVITRTICLAAGINPFE
ncbi:FAD binding domain-containing protein [bacterium]|nr:FAD binding domain-containing protein [bacterium]